MNKNEQTVEDLYAAKDFPSLAQHILNACNDLLINPNDKKIFAVLTASRYLAERNEWQKESGTGLYYSVRIAPPGGSLNAAILKTCDVVIDKELDAKRRYSAYAKLASPQCVQPSNTWLRDNLLVRAAHCASLFSVMEEKINTLLYINSRLPGGTKAEGHVAQLWARTIEQLTAPAAQKAAYEKARWPDTAAYRLAQAKLKELTP